MTERISYPRTYHLPFSDGLQSDDKRIETLDLLKGREVVALLKKDGENTSLYKGEGNFHARSLDSPYNWTRTMAKQIHNFIQHDIPEGWRLCCENVYAKHSIYYPDGYLEGYLYLLSIWNEKNECLSYDETLEWAGIFDLPVPREIYRGPFDLKALEEKSKQLDTSIEEGFVVRVTDSFQYDEFSKVVTKFVRKDHVQTADKHWLSTATPNGLPKSPSKPAFLDYQFNRKKKLGV
jgi:hypothetical protein